ACDPSHYTWIQRAVDTWALLARGALQLPADSLPWVVLFDARCSWELAPRRALAEDAREVSTDAKLRYGGSPVVVHATVHRDSIRLPSGSKIPPRPAAFASLYRGDS